MNVKFKEPDWEGFGRAVVGIWPKHGIDGSLIVSHWGTNGIDGPLLFCMAQDFGVVRVIAGGFNPDEHIDAEGIAPEAGDPWYEYNFGLAPSVTDEDIQRGDDVHPVEVAMRKAEGLDHGI